jgi:hypothetical protein
VSPKKLALKALRFLILINFRNEYSGTVLMAGMMNGELDIFGRKVS